MRGKVITPTLRILLSGSSDPGTHWHSLSRSGGGVGTRSHPNSLEAALYVKRQNLISVTRQTKTNKKRWVSSWIGQGWSCRRTIGTRLVRMQTSNTFPYDRRFGFNTRDENRDLKYLLRVGLKIIKEKGFEIGDSSWGSTTDSEGKFIRFSSYNKEEVTHDDGVRLKVVY